MRDEMIECTFTPKINDFNIISTKSIDKMKGIDKFFSIVDMKNKKKEEDMRIMEKMFEMHIKYDLEKHSNPTKLLPFNLSANRE